MVSLDVFRGIIVAGMILVTDPGTYDAIYPQLRHAEWTGATATDMIFPSFLFMVGMSVALSIRARLSRGVSKPHIASRVFYRTVLLFVLGLAINGFPDYNWHLLRLPGILQRIAVCYFCCAMLYLYLNYFGADNADRGKLNNNLLKPGMVAAILLLGYWALIRLVPVPGIGTGLLDSYGNLPAYIDRSVIGINHMWAYGLTPGRGVTYDPEGILSTLPAMASAFIGLMAGEWWLRTSAGPYKKILIFGVSGVILIVASVALATVLPVNKRIWTSSFALISSGVAIILFTVIYFVVDLKQWRKWSVPFLIFGTNAILAFIISSVITTLFDRISIFASNGKSLSIHEWGNHLGLSLGLSPVNASLLYALVIVLLNMALVLPLYHKKIFLKI